MKTNLENYEERFVDYMEGLLDATEMREVEAFIAQHPELEEDFKLFCSTKLEPDTNVVYTKKESLIRPATVIRPLFLKMAAVAACLALLIGIGFRFLKPHQGLEQQPMMAELSPITAQPISVQQDIQALRKSDAKPISAPKTTVKARTVETIEEVEPVESIATGKPMEMVATAEPVELIAAAEPVELIAAVPSVEPKLLEQGDALAYDDIELRMDVELGERLSMVEPLPDVPFDLDLRDVFFGDLGQTTKALYRRTAKAIMDVYHTADYRINEAKEDLMASR